MIADQKYALLCCDRKLVVVAQCCGIIHLDFGSFTDIIVRLNTMGKIVNSDTQLWINLFYIIIKCN